MKRILCIWLPNWPIQRLSVVHPELKQHPLALYEVDSRRGQLVAYCNRTSRTRGVHCGMRLSDAQALIVPDSKKSSKTADRQSADGQSADGQTADGRQRADQPALRFQPHDPQADREALADLAVWCEQFSPLVGLEESERPEGLLLDVTGLASLFGGEDLLARQIVMRLRQRGYYGHLAIAHTVGAAWGISRFGIRLASEQTRVEQRVFISTSRRDEEALAALPLTALRLSPSVVEMLAELGIQCIDQLRSLPRSGLATRFGQHVVKRLDQALGDLEEVIVAHRPPALFSAGSSLEHPTAHRQTLDQIVSNLVQQVARQLAQRSEGAVRLVCSLFCDRTSPVDIRIGLFQPTSNASHLMDLVRMQMELLVVPGAVDRIHVEVTATGKLQQQQQRLFGNQTSGQTRKLAILVDQLSSRLGRQHVVRAELQATANPELAFRYVPLAGNDRTRSGRRANRPSSPVHAPDQRPLRCYIPPVPVHVVAIAPYGPPSVLHFQNQRFAVARHWGPERIETQWWRGQSVRRDYFRVETDTGMRFWIFRRLQDQAWFLQGEFE